MGSFLGKRGKIPLQWQFSKINQNNGGGELSGVREVQRTMACGGDNGGMFLSISFRFFHFRFFLSISFCYV